MLGEIYKNRGYFGFFFLFNYYLSAIICGFQCSDLNYQYQGKSLQATIIFTSFICPFMLFCNYTLVQIISYCYYSNFSISIFLQIAMYYSCIYLPLFFIGYVINRKYRMIFPCNKFFSSSNKESSIEKP